MTFFKRIIALIMMLLSFLFPDIQQEQVGNKGTYNVKNDTVYIYVAENGSTGYKWEYDIEGSGLKYSDSLWKSDVDDRNIVGAGGTSTYIFVADGEGEFTLTMQYLRPWEDSLPAKTLTLKGNTDENGNVTIAEAVGIEPAE